MKKTYIPLTINTEPVTRVKRHETEQEKTERLMKLAERLKVRLVADEPRKEN